MADSLASRRPLGRLLGASAIVASVFLHGGAAALALLVLPRVMARPDVAHRDEAPAVVDINVMAPAELDGPPEIRPQSASTARPSHARASSQRPRGSATVAQQISPAASALPVPPVPSASSEQPVRPVTARFALSAGSVAGRSDVPGGSGETPGAERAEGDASDGAGPLPESGVDEPARIAATAPLAYPESARRAEVELDLPLELVISPQGRVVSARALSHPGYGLEEAALAAVRSYAFRPARRAGHDVTVRMKWTMQFRLR
jgi:TonB family protein